MTTENIWGGSASGGSIGGGGSGGSVTDINAILPSQAGNAGKVLGTDGAVCSWVTVPTGGGGGGGSGTAIYVGVEKFSGGAVSYTLSAVPANINNLIVTVDGIVQVPTTDYTISGTTLTPVIPWVSGTNNIVVWVIQGTISGSGGAPTWGGITGTLSAQTDLQNALNLKANSSAVPAQFNPVAGTNITLSGTYPNITFNATGSGGSATWGGITGTLSAQTDLQAALNAKADTTHSHATGDITSLLEYIQDSMASTLVAGSNITLTYNDVAGTLTIDAAGGGGSSGVTIHEDFFINLATTGNIGQLGWASTAVTIAAAAAEVGHPGIASFTNTSTTSGVAYIYLMAAKALAWGDFVSAEFSVKFVTTGVTCHIANIGLWDAYYTNVGSTVPTSGAWFQLYPNGANTSVTLSRATASTLSTLSVSAVTSSAWHKYKIVKNGSNVDFYIDGSLVGSITAPASGEFLTPVIQSSNGTVSSNFLIDHYTLVMNPTR